MKNDIYLTEQSLKELLEGKKVYNNGDILHPPKTNGLNLSLKKNKEYIGSVIVVRDSVVEENIPFTNGNEAEDIFLEQCRLCLSNFDEYSTGDIETICENGRETFGHGFIAIQHF